MQQVMAKMELMNAKGTRDFPPEKKILKNLVTDKLREVFELYGYSPLETPLIERYDILAAKYAGGAEILKETFKLTDQAKRKLCLRYDLTVPFSRYVGMNPRMKMPFKRYQVGRVFRDGPIKLGRYREFWQCDIDVVGAKSMVADAEIIQMTLDCFAKIGFNVIVEVNNRKVLNGIMKEVGVPDNKCIDVILTIDKIKKVSLADLKKELKEKGLDAKKIERLLEIIQVQGTNKQKLDALSKILTNGEGKQGLEEVRECLSYVKSKNAVFSVSLCRGLAYYTGTVFEAVLKNHSFTSSLAGGGRYDKMIGDFLGSAGFPAVGISFGLEPIVEVMKMDGYDEGKKTVTSLFVAPVGTLQDSLSLAQEFRAAGIKTEIDLVGRNPSKNLKYANSLGISYVLFVGEEEVKKGKFTLKNMKDGSEFTGTVKQIIARIS